ncbi:MAG: cupin domain-containing protein [Planctomycetota bacterium]|nr:cupin domain-containing protein [Planctomycetota bacterium]
MYRSPQLVNVARWRGLRFLTIPGAPGKRAIQIMRETYAPGADTGSEPYSHEGEEGGFCISGTVEITVDGRKEILRAGDAYYYPSKLPHRWRNIGRGPAVVVSACSPPTF